MPLIEGLNLESQPLAPQSPQKTNEEPAKTEAASPAKEVKEVKETKETKAEAAPEKEEKEKAPKTPSELSDQTRALIQERMLGRKIEDVKDDDKEGEVKDGEEKPEGKAKLRDDGGKEKTEKEGKRGAAKKKAKEPTAAEQLYTTAKESNDEEEETEQRPRTRPKPAAATKEDVARIVAEANEQVRRSQAQSKETSTSEAGVDDEDRELITQLDAVSKLYPDEYAGRDLKKEYQAHVQRYVDYEAAWTREHPDETLDWNSAEHSAWMDSHRFDVNQRHMKQASEVLQKARIRAEAQVIASQENEPIRKELQRLKAREVAGPEIQRAITETMMSVVEAIRPDLTEGKTSEEIFADHEALGAEISKDPVDATVARAAIDHAKTVLSLAGQLHYGMMDYDANNSSHIALKGELERMQQEIASLPEERRPTINGRRFLTMEQQRSKKNPEGTYTVFDWDALQTLVAMRVGNLAKIEKKRAEEHWEKVAKARGYGGKGRSKEQETVGNGSSESTRKSSGPSVGAASTTAGKPADGVPSKPGGLSRELWEKVGGRFR